MQPTRVQRASAALFAPPLRIARDQSTRLRDRCLDHLPPHIGIAGRGHRFVRLARRVKDGERLVQMLAPGDVDLLAGGRFASFGIAAERRAGKHAGNSFDQGISETGILILRVPRSTRLARFGFGGRHAGDLARRMDQLDRQHGDDRAVMLDPDFREGLKPPRLERAGRARLRPRPRTACANLLLAFGADDSGALFDEWLRLPWRSRAASARGCRRP